MRPAWVIAITPILLVSCANPKAGYDLSTKAAQTLHERMEAGRNAEIFSDTTPQFQASLTFANFDGFMQRIKRKLGSCEHGSVTGMNFNANTSGTFMTLGYRRKCANGELAETQVWQVANGSAKLVNYSANSPLLLTD